jgi:hypothetical protein
MPNQPPKMKKAAERLSVMDRLRFAAAEVVETPGLTFTIIGEHVHEMWREAKSRAENKSVD